MTSETSHLHITQLFQHNLNNLLTLQVDVLESLTPYQKPFVYERSAEKYLAHIHNHEIIGGFIDNQLVACLINPKPENLDDVGRIIPINLLPQAVIMGGLLVAPQHQHHHYGRSLIESTISQNPTHHFIAEVLPNNFASWKSFVKLGFNVVKANLSPIDNEAVMWLKFEENKNPSKNLAARLNPANDFKALQQQLSITPAKAYQGNDLLFYQV